MPSRSFWSDKSVLVTGHTGFKGSWLSLWLESLGARVTGYALPPAGSPNLFELCELERSIPTVYGDIRNRSLLLQTIRDAQPEIVFHLAAQPLVRYSYVNPAETYEVNVMGTVNLLESVREAAAEGAGIRAVVNVTTDKCYDNKEWVWGYRENDRLGGFDPYSNSKACAELVTSSYRSSYFPPGKHAAHGLGLATARAGNVIGGGDWSEDRIIPDCVRALFTGSKPAIRNPAAIRPWQHVLEPLRGYLLLAQSLAEEGGRFAEAWNFGPGDEDVKSVEWLVRKIGTCWGRQDFYECATGGHPHEAQSLRLDSSKARQALGWLPVWDVKQAVEQTAAWYQAYQRQADMRVICLEQLDTYGQAGGQKQ
ncbi:MAG: rfbG 1 [Paenibacillaceae bacterium]|jgi:CDP-glucose 4,6-dehydratase|nr:rfbG 1 [Paenibacillaceae bacterium]